MVPNLIFAIAVALADVTGMYENAIVGALVYPVLPDVNVIPTTLP